MFQLPLFRKRGEGSNVKAESHSSMLFGVGPAPAGESSLSDSYRSAYFPELDLFYQAERGKMKPFRPASYMRARHLTIFDFIAPFIKYYLILLAGWLLATLAHALPSLLPPPAFISGVTRYMALVALFLEFLRAFTRSYRGRFSRILPHVPRMDKKGLHIYRRYGRRAWFAWYLCKPFLTVIKLGAACMIAFGAATFLRALWAALPSTLTVAPARGPEPFFGRPEPTIGSGIHSMLRFMRIVFFVLGIFTYLLALINCGLQRPWARTVVGGLVMWGMAGFIQLMVTFEGAPETTIDLGQ